MAAPTFIEKYVKTGQVRLIFQELPLDGHQNAVVAAEAARCAGDQGKYWEMHDLLFENQRVWSVQANPRAIYAAYASKMGIDSAAFTKCLSDGTNRQAITASKAAAAAKGLTGTPSFAVNGTIVNTFGAQTVDDIVVRVESAIAEAQ